MSKLRPYFPFLAVLLLGLGAATVRADHPEAEKLLPEKTVFFMKIKSVDEFTKGFMETGFMKMLQDEEVAPVVESLYGSAEDAFAEAEAALGVSLNELQNMLTGEVCFAVVAQKDEPISIALFADYKGNAETADTLLSFGEQAASDGGQDLDEEDVEGVSIRSIETDDDNQIHYFQKNDSLCASNNQDLAKLLLARWMLVEGEELSADFQEEMTEKLAGRTLKKNRKFLNVINACDPDEDNPPQGLFFADVFEIIKSSQSGVAGTALVGILRGLGVDGLLGIGGSMTTSHEEFESIIHLHVALANPRAGLIKMIALEPGDLTPEPIFPPNVTNYLTTNWNTITSYNEIEKIYDLFNGEGALAEELADNFSGPLGVELKEDLLMSLDGRMSFGQVTVDSEALNGQAIILAAKLKDPLEFKSIFADLRDSIADRRDEARRARDEEGEDRPRRFRRDNEDEPIFNSAKYKGVEYFTLPGPPTAEERERWREEAEQRRADNGDEPRPQRRRQVAFQIREPSPCMGIVGDYLVFTDSVDFMKMAITNNKNPDDILSDDPDYKKLLREIKRQLDGKKPAMISFQRPEETFRMLFDAVQHEQTQSAIQDRAEDNPFFGAMAKAFIDNKLPDFEDMTKYFQPTAGVMTNDETGFHYMAFSPKIEEDE